MVWGSIFHGEADFDGHMPVKFIIIAKELNPATADFELSHQNGCRS
jgi:hypothetical protein